MLRIYVGSTSNPTYLFEDDRIFSSTVTQNVALVGQELSIDTFSPVVADSMENVNDITLFRTSDGKVLQMQDSQIYALSIHDAQTSAGLIDLPDGTPVWYYCDDELVGRFYLESVKRQAKNQYQLNCVSAIGRLDHLYHGGGLFQAQRFGDVLAHIMASGLHGDGAPAIDYAIDDDVADLTVSGWLPYATRRENLYQLIFANGINIIKNPDGNPRFTFVYTAGSRAVAIPNKDIFNGGNIEYTRPYSSVSIMEHTYSDLTADVEPVVLYDNTESTRISGEEIWFDQAPVITSTLVATEGLTIDSATENSAILTGNGKLTGVPYTHTTRTVSRKNSGGERDKTISVTDCTMVNEVNSGNLLNRLYAFYCPPNYIKKVSNDIVFKDQRCGKQYLFANPYGEREVAFLAGMENRASSFNRASCEFYAGYDPVGQAGLYQNCIILDKATYAEDGGVFTVPEEVFEQQNPQMRVVIIGGGTGGWSGWPGENGSDAYGYTDVASDADISGMWYGGEGGDGGKGGDGGTPGRVYSITITNPDATYNYTIGDGGEGGAATGFIPDTADEIARLLRDEDPDHEPTQEEIQDALDAELALTDWDGSPNEGTAGTASTFGSYSSDDQDSYVPPAGVYNPLYAEFYALPGNKGLNGGKGGARKVGDDEAFTWVTDGEDVQLGDVVYEGGRTGSPLTSVTGLPEVKLIAYGGNGAGAAVGIQRPSEVEYEQYYLPGEEPEEAEDESEDVINPHMDGGSEFGVEWEITWRS